MALGQCMLRITPEIGRVVRRLRRIHQPPAGWMRFAYPPYIHQFSLVRALGPLTYRY